MADVRPFQAVRFDPRRVDLSRVLCPPYDVIGPEKASALRRGRFNAVHLELPMGRGAEKYRRAARIWKEWRLSGLLGRDAEPAFYVCEERFSLEGRSYRRRGFLGALGVTPAAFRWIVPHERTLPKPKADRLRLLAAVRANISPIFGFFPDSGGIRALLRRTAARRPEASGTLEGVGYRLWRLTQAAETALIRRALARRKIVIADGHHRCEVGRAYHGKRRSAGSETVLAYLCSEADPGLIVLPTHRVVAQEGLLERARRLCRVSRRTSLKDLLEGLARLRDPYAFGLYEGGFYLARPRHAGGCRSRLGVEWLAHRLLVDVPPEGIAYTHEARQALSWARRRGGAAVFVKPVTVPQIRKAVDAVGLLPPKSTYFYPKVATGLVFKPL